MRLRVALPAGLLVAALAATACGGGPEREPDVARRGAGPSPTLVAPPAFERLVADPATETINVHVPDEGSIPGTDSRIPFDRLEARRADLPQTSTPLAVYCRTGRMSAIAVRTLRRLGYRRVTELRGGMEAWRASGRTLRPD